MAPIVVDPAVITEIQNDIQNIENELGVDPNGVYSTVRTRLDILEARINNPLAPAPNVENPFFIGNNGVSISTGDGYPTENRVDGSLYLRQDGYANEGLYSRSAGVWNLVGSGGGGGGFTAGGDLSGSSTSQTVIGIQGNSISSTAPTNGQVLTYVTSSYEPKLPAVIYDTLSAESNIRRSVASCTIDNTKTGITNLAENSSATDNYATISGGYNNSILTASPPSYGFSFIGGGEDNIINGADYCSILGGESNSIGNGGIYSNIIGGNFNSIGAAFHAVVVGGHDNSIDSSSNYSHILNGYSNSIGNGSSYNTIANGFSNQILASSNFNLIKGQSNTIQGSASNNNISGNSNTISASCNNVHVFGNTNVAQTPSAFAIIFGSTNTAYAPNTQIFGNSNTSISINSFIKGNSNNLQGTRAIVFGDNNTLANRCTDHVIFGGNNSVGDTSTTNFILGNNNNFASVTDRNLVVGSSNTVNHDDSVILGSSNISNSNYSIISGTKGKSSYNGQFVHAVNGFTTAGYSQYSRVILTGSAIGGNQFNLTINGANLALENDKSYDMCIRILVVSTTGSMTCAQYVYDVLAHQTAGTLTLDNTNITLSIDNGTLWTITIAGGSELIITVDALGSDDRRAIATVEWRELSRL